MRDSIAVSASFARLLTALLYLHCFASDPTSSLFASVLIYLLLACHCIVCATENFFAAYFSGRLSLRDSFTAIVSHDADKSAEEKHPRYAAT
jgi:hypothetical protein